MQIQAVTPPAAPSRWQQAPSYTYQSSIVDTHRLGAGPLRIADDSSSVLTAGHAASGPFQLLQATSSSDAVTETASLLQKTLQGEHARGWTDQDANWSSVVLQDGAKGAYYASTPDMSLGESSTVQSPEHYWWARDRRTSVKSWTPQNDDLRALVYGTGDPVVFDGSKPVVRTTTTK